MSVVLESRACSTVLYLELTGPIMLSKGTVHWLFLNFPGEPEDEILIIIQSINNKWNVIFLYFSLCMIRASRCDGIVT